MRLLRQEAILDAARTIFEETGLDGATIRAIAQRAGCTTGAIYPLFESKEHIYAELLQRSLKALHSAVTAAADAAEPETAHHAAARAFLRYYSEHPFEVNLGLYAFRGLKHAGVGKALDRKLNDTLAATVCRFSPGQRGRRGSVPDADAMIVFGQLIGLLVLHLSGRLKLGRTAPADLLETFLETQARR